MKQEDITGNVYNRLTAIQLIEKKKRTPYRGNHHIWLFKCVCGNDKIAIKANVISGNVKSCGCLKSELSKTSIQKLIKPAKNNQASINELYGDYKRDAKKRNYTFELSLEEFTAIIRKNCHYCGIEPKNIYKKRKTKKYMLIFNGIDRQDNTIGYISSNCVPCCVQCNVSKRDKTLEEFNNWIDRLIQHRSKSQ